MPVSSLLISIFFWTLTLQILTALVVLWFIQAKFFKNLFYSQAFLIVLSRIVGRKQHSQLLLQRKWLKVKIWSCHFFPQKPLVCPNFYSLSTPTFIFAYFSEPGILFYVSMTFPIFCTLPGVFFCPFTASKTNKKTRVNFFINHVLFFSFFKILNWGYASTDF